MICGAVGKWARVRGTKSNWWEFCLAGWGVLSGGCSDDGTAKTPFPDAEHVPSRPGIVQVAGDDGLLLGERDACERFRTAWQTNRLRLACGGEQSLWECPALVQPLASMKCVSYTLDSVTSCTEKFDSAERCDELIAGACVLTAVSHVPSPECVSDADGSVDSSESQVETSETSAAVSDSGAFAETGEATSGAGRDSGLDSGLDFGLESNAVETKTPGASTVEAETTTPLN